MLVVAISEIMLLTSGPWGCVLLMGVFHSPSLSNIWRFHIKIQISAFSGNSWREPFAWGKGAGLGPQPLPSPLFTRIHSCLISSASPMGGPQMLGFESRQPNGGFARSPRTESPRTASPVPSAGPASPSEASGTR